jgi:hypothetical protein
MASLYRCPKSVCMKTPLALLLFILPGFLYAQKNVDLDKFHISVKLRSLPQIRLDSSFRTYHVTVEGTRLMQPLLNEMTPEKQVWLEGWRKLEQNGHIAVNIKLGDLLPETFSIKERQENVRDAGGRITGTRRLFYEEVIYTFEAAAVITDYEGILNRFTPAPNFRCAGWPKDISW